MELVRKVSLNAQTKLSQVNLEFAKTKAALRLERAINITNTPAILKNPALKFSESRVVTKPKALNIGMVPSVNINIANAPEKIFPEAMAVSSMAWVTPQGIKTVRVPKIAGAKSVLDLD